METKNKKNKHMTPRVCHFMQCNKIKKYKKSHEFAA